MIALEIGPQLDPQVFAEGPGAWLELVLEIYGGFAGEAVVGLLLGVGLMVALYVHSGDMALPTVVLLLISPVLYGVLPGDYQQIAVVFIILGGISATFTLLWRYVV